MTAELSNADLILRIKDLEAALEIAADMEHGLWLRNRELQAKLDMLTSSRSPMPTISDEPQYEYE